ncbi:MAG: hypothetical protein WA364_14035 [Candidatus Nitrosopolaris sp.]
MKEREAFCEASRIDGLNCKYDEVIAVLMVVLIDCKSLITNVKEKGPDIKREDTSGISDLEKLNQ